MTFIERYVRRSAKASGVPIQVAQMETVLDVLKFLEQ
jgi:hypothetical protein